MDLDVADFYKWTPIRVYTQDDGLFVDWCFLGDERFTDPFHDDTIDIVLRKPFNSLFWRRTPINFLGELYEKRRGLDPSGFIFHVSRCGSTLVSQMLAAASPHNIVISEASIIDKITRAETLLPGVADEQKIVWLRWLLSALAPNRTAREKHFFVKFDSWSVLNLQLIKKAFPAVPWIFMYRNPVEVIVSNLRQPGMQMIPGAIAVVFPQMDFIQILQMSTEERFARTIAAFCAAALEHAADPNGIFVNYKQLPGAVFDEITRHFRVSFSDDEIEKMRGSSKFHAKTPRAEFKSDSREKRSEASEAVIDAAAQFVDPLYSRLENHRLGHAE